MSLKSKQWGAALYEIAKKTPAEQLPTALKEFAALLAQHGLTGQLEKIYADFIECYNKKEKVTDVILESPYELTASEQQKIISELAKYINRKIELKTSVNKNLLGGAIFYIGDYLADGSLSGQLKKLKTEFIKE